jgi:hypothetical protein
MGGSASIHVSAYAAEFFQKNGAPLAVPALWPTPSADKGELVVGAGIFQRPGLMLWKGRLGVTLKLNKNGHKTASGRFGGAGSPKRAGGAGPDLEAGLERATS